MADLEFLVDEAANRFAAAPDSATLENEKARYLGKTGALTELLKGLGKLEAEARKREGAQINSAKQKSRNCSPRADKPWPIRK